MSSPNKKIDPNLHRKIKKAIFEDETHALIVKNRLVAKGMKSEEATQAVNYVLRVEKENFRKKSAQNMILGATAIGFVIPYTFF